MATTPASMEGIRHTHVDKVREFLRRSPPMISKDYIVKNLLGTGKGFQTRHDIDNRVTHAKATGELVSQGRGKEFRNMLAQPASAAASPVKHINGSSANGGDASEAFEILSPYMESAKILADAAVIDKSITREEVLQMLLMTTAAFSAVSAGQKQSHS